MFFTIKLTAFYNKESPLYVAQRWLSLLLDPYRSAALSLSLRRLSAAIITQMLTQKLMNLVHYTIVVSIACSSTMSVFRLKIPVRINIWTGTRWCSKFFLNELIYEVRLTSFASRSNLWRLKCVWIFQIKKHECSLQGWFLSMTSFAWGSNFISLKNVHSKKDVQSSSTLNLPS